MRARMHALEYNPTRRSERMHSRLECMRPLASAGLCMDPSGSRMDLLCMHLTCLLEITRKLARACRMQTTRQRSACPMQTSSLLRGDPYRRAQCSVRGLRREMCRRAFGADDEQREEGACVSPGGAHTPHTCRVHPRRYATSRGVRSVRNERAERERETDDDALWSESE